MIVLYKIGFVLCKICLKALLSFIRNTVFMCMFPENKIDRYYAVFCLKYGFYEASMIVLNFIQKP